MEPDGPRDKNIRDHKELQIARAALVRDRTALRNRLATQHLALTRRQTRARLAQVERQIAALDEELDTRLAACPAQARSQAILTSIPGIGAITARALLIECPEIGRLTSKQIAALAGLAPMTRQSGQRRGKAVIQGGRKPLRDALFMPALVAMKRNPDLSLEYDQMRAAGKPHKVALTTLMRKLIQLANTLIKEDRLSEAKHA